MEILLLLSIPAFHAWRYSKTSVDPDWAYFNLWGFTGSAYGRDFVDCKTPAIHVWFLLLSKLAGRNVGRVKFLHHFLLGSVGVPLFLITGNLYFALAYCVLVNSGWLLAFHGNVGQHPAAFISLALAVNDPIWSPVLWTGALAFEPKLLPSFAVLYFKTTLVLGAVGLVVYLVLRNREWFKWIWESSVVIPARMGKGRKGQYEWMPWFTCQGVLYLIPWLGVAVIERMDALYWLPVLLYIIVIGAGSVVRQNHLLPLASWIAFVISPTFAVLLLVVDVISSGFYFGNIWKRFYTALDELNNEAQAVGEYLKNKGRVYVNGIHSAIYIHAQAPVQFGFAEQVEIRDQARERRAVMVEKWKANPPDWFVMSMGPGIRFKPVGYHIAKKIGNSTIYRRDNHGI